MKAIILAGGKGTRLYPVTLETPKPLLPVRKKPILNYLIELFLEQGIFEYYDFSSPSFSMLEKDLFPKLATAGELFGFPYKGEWHDCGTFERWQEAIENWTV